MHENQTGASRYDRILGGEGLHRSGFDPQTLDFGVVRYEVPDVGVLDGVSVAFSVNRQADGRFEQARPGVRLDRQSSATTALGYQGQVHKDLGLRQRFIAGTEFYDEQISAERQLVDPTVTTAARPDIPDGTSYSSFGAFGQYTADVLPNRLTVSGGLRANAFRFSTATDPVLGVVEENVSSDDVTFQGSAVVRIVDNVNFTANVTRAFRAPNAGDLGSIGLTGGGGFEITPSRAAELGAVVGSTGAADARSTGESLEGLQPEVVYQYDFGVKAQAGKVSAALNVFDMELYNFIQRRALVFEPGIVGTTISGFQVVRQDASGLAYIAQDVRPIASRVNVDRGRFTGFDAVTDVRFNRSWSASGFFSMTQGKVLSTGAYVRRMPPAMGHAKVRWQNERVWAEGVLNLGLEQTRLDSGDLSDARIGALRTRASIGTFFNGTATDLGLVRNGILVETGENLAAVQNRVLGTAASAPLYTSEPGYAVVSLRGGVNLGGGVDLTLLGENLGDKNYRIYGSGLDAPGRSLHARVTYRFWRLRPGSTGLDPGQSWRFRGRYSSYVVGGALLPLVATLASIVTILEPRAWLSPADWRGLAPVAILFSTAVLLIAAPLAGVTVAARARGLALLDGAWAATRRTCGTLLFAAVSWTAAAAGLTAMLAAAAGETVSTPLFAAHVVQGAAALALALTGALAAGWFEEPLDAGALSLVLALAGSLGILVAGALVDRLPGAVVEWAVAANPLLAVSSAAHIDVMRTDTLYQISPLAHVQVPVPGWPAAAALYVAVAAACAAALGGVYSRIASEPSVHQH